MSEPAALIRARSLRKHIKRLGCTPDEFFVGVTREEGFELLRWFRDELKREQITDERMNLDLLDRDIDRARRKNDPFPVLEHFNLAGLAIRPSH